MHPSNASNPTIAGLALAVAVVTLLGLVLLILMFLFSSGPLGMLNDICNGLGAVLSVALALALLGQHQLRSPAAGRAGVDPRHPGRGPCGRGLGAGDVGHHGLLPRRHVYDDRLRTHRALAAGHQLSCAVAPRGWSHLGLIAGAVMVLGLAAIPSMFMRIDSFGDAAWHSWLGQAGLSWLGQSCTPSGACGCGACFARRSDSDLDGEKQITRTPRSRTRGSAASHLPGRWQRR